MEKRLIEIPETSVVEDDVYKRIKFVGVRNIDLEKTKELGFFTRISNLLCASHAAVMAAYRIYGGVDYMLRELGGRKNDIAKAMNEYEKSFTRFVNFWTGYYANGQSGREMNEDTEILYRRIMQWAQLPFEWNLGDEQHVKYEDLSSAVYVNTDSDMQYIFSTTNISTEAEGEVSESWCVTKFDTSRNTQETIEQDIDKASAMMVAKRLSADDSDNIYTASILMRYTETKEDLIPYKVYKANNTVGKIAKQTNR